jgi:hypothetical protein
MDVELQNKTLLLKWIESDTQSLWPHTLSSIGVIMDTIKQMNVDGSFFNNNY